MSKLGKDFFLRPTLEVARDLLSKELFFEGSRFIISETEAYVGKDDPACHASSGKRTKRNEIMFWEAGHIYIYLIYGMYYCMNFVTEEEGFPAAVLLRGLKPVDSNNKIPSLNGPGKLTKFLGIDKEYNGMDIINNDRFYVSDINLKSEYITTPRIGISKGKEKLWRFVLT